MSDLSRHGVPVFVTASQWADIDNWNLHLHLGYFRPEGIRRTTQSPT
jgi:hypothetical protein